MERVIRGRSFTLVKTFYEDGVATDPDSPPTVAITRSDGSTVTAGAVTNETPDGTWSVTVPASSNLLLDTLTADWAATVNGVAQEYLDVVEVAGDVLFTVAEMQADLGTSTTSYTAAQIATARTYAETQLERACGVAFVARYARETFSGNGTTTVLLRWPRVTAVRSVSIDGADVTPVSSVVALREGIGYLSTGWTAGYGNVVIDYEHGDSVLDPGASEAALVLAKHKLVKGPIDERATQRSSEFGPVNLATPGMFGSRFGIPVVDAFIAANNMNVGVA